MKHTMHLFCACALIFLFSCGGDGNTDTGNETGNSDSINNLLALNVSTTNCPAPAAWFVEDGNGNRRTPGPLEGTTSAFANNSTVSNCDFQQWAWQKFLWLTNEYNGRPLFMDSLNQVTAAGHLVSSPLITLIDTSQASNPTLDILQTPDFAAGTPPRTTVYSAIFQDSLMFATMIKYAPIAKANRAAVVDVAYPVGSLELKTTWIATTGLTDSSDYFITDGTINGVPSRVALLAMHVVGVVENHPEFIWATFEHDGLAPSYDWDAATPTTDAPVTSTTDYPFFAAGATATTANITSGVAAGPHTNVFGIYKYGVPVEKVDDGSPNGKTQYMSTCETNPDTTVTNIETLNQSVKSQLSGVWNQYFLNGSLWLNPGDRNLAQQIALLDSLGQAGATGTVIPDAGYFARGSVAAYNITMETYVQAGFRSGAWTIHETNINTPLANCFSCHSASDYISATEIYQSPLYLSHIFTGYMKTLDGFNRSEVKEHHAKGIRAQFEAQKNK